MNNEQLMGLIVEPEIKVVDAMQKIDSNMRGLLFVVNERQHLTGVVTDGDIRRWLIKTGRLQEPICNLMNKSPKFIFRKDMEEAVQQMDKYTITAIPVLDSKKRVIDVIFRDEAECIEERIDQETLAKVAVVVMAGGKGTRLYPYTKVLPKPLIPIGDIPIMERIIARFRKFGVSDFYATLNYRKNMIKSYFSELCADYSITYVEENEPLGTAGSLHLIEKEFSNPIFVTNCDVLIDTNYSDLYQYHLDSGNELTIVTALKNIVVPYGVVHSKENGIISSMEEKPKLSYFVNTGMYILNPELLKEIPENQFYHMTDLTDLLLTQNRQVGMYPISEDSFLDMGEFEEMNRMEKKLHLKTE